MSFADRPREDAVKHRPSGRYFVPTTNETVWVSTWEEFKAVGGVVNFFEDQSDLLLTLPPGHKFSIRFMRRD